MTRLFAVTDFSKGKTGEGNQPLMPIIKPDKKEKKQRRLRENRRGTISTINGNSCQRNRYYRNIALYRERIQGKVI